MVKSRLARGLAITATASGAGKTLITLGLLGALKARGVAVGAAKTGPDYIDPAFHALALGGGEVSVNLDAFAMGEALIRQLAHHQNSDMLIIEGAMGVADGGKASTATLANILAVPMVLIIDARGVAETAALVAAGLDKMLKGRFANTGIAGVIVNHCRSPRHLDMIRDAMEAVNIPLLGGLPSAEALAIPSRHLGLVQAAELLEHGNLADIIAEAAAQMETHIDLDRLLALATPLAPPPAPPTNNVITALPPPAQRIAVAQDAAFAFAYPHVLDGWRRGGAEILPFSPLNDEAPDATADMVYLPGGYPELHLDRLAANQNWQESLRGLAKKSVFIYGECGGYMVLGQAIIGQDGAHVPMLGLLDVVTSFAETKLHLGYRQLECLADVPLPRHAFAHEFHYTTCTEHKGANLFTAGDKNGTDLGAIGSVRGSVCGSYAHLIAAP